MRVVCFAALSALPWGCASLDPRPDLEQSARAVEQAVGVSSELLLLDQQAASMRIEALLASGLSADEAVQVALLNHPRARAALLSVGISRADFVQSTLFSNPFLTLSLRFPDGGGLANFETALTQNIAELWLIPARKQAARRQLDQAVLLAAQELAEIAYEVRRAYIRAVKARRAQHLAREALDLSRRLLEITELRQQAGTGSAIDVNLARSKSLEAESTLRESDRRIIESASELARALGLSVPPGTLQLVSDLPDPPKWNTSADALREVARSSRLDLQVVEQVVAEAQARVREERVRFLKSVEVGFALERAERRSRGGRDWLAETFYDSLQSGQLTPPNLMPRESADSELIAGPTFGVELPLWDHNQAQIAKADRRLERALQLRDALLVDVDQDIHAHLAGARSAAEAAVFYRDQQLPAAQSNLTLAREAYQAGRQPFAAVLEAERSYLTARSGLLDVLERAALTAIELERVTGRPAAALRNGQDQALTRRASGEVQP